MMWKILSFYNLFTLQYVCTSQLLVVVRSLAGGVRHVHVETRRRLTKFEVRTQVPPLMHWCVCGEKGDAYMVLWYIHTTTKQQNNLYSTAKS